MNVSIISYSTQLPNANHELIWVNFRWNRIDDADEYLEVLSRYMNENTNICLEFSYHRAFFFLSLLSVENSSQVVIIPIILSSLAVVLISSILAVLKCRFELCPDFSFLAHSASLSTDRISMPMDCRKPGEFAVSDQYPMGKVLILRLTFDSFVYRFRYEEL